MRFELGDFSISEQTEIINILNNYNENTKIQQKRSIGFNDDMIYNFIEQQ